MTIARATMSLDPTLTPCLCDKQAGPSKEIMGGTAKLEQLGGGGGRHAASAQEKPDILDRARINPRPKPRPPSNKGMRERPAAKLSWHGAYPPPPRTISRDGCCAGICNASVRKRCACQRRKPTQHYFGSRCGWAKRGARLTSTQDRELLRQVGKQPRDIGTRWGPTTPHCAHQTRF